LTTCLRGKAQRGNCGLIVTSPEEVASITVCAGGARGRSWQRRHADRQIVMDTTSHVPQTDGALVRLAAAGVRFHRRGPDWWLGVPHWQPPIPTTRPASEHPLGRPAARPPSRPARAPEQQRRPTSGSPVGAAALRGPGRSTRSGSATGPGARTVTEVRLRGGDDPRRDQA
jgi:hypothetical protein